MYIIPSIYIRGNKTVQLATGGRIFDENPVNMARLLNSAGAEVIYVSDLEAPVTGRSPNLSTIEEIINSTGLKVYLTGHLKSVDTIEKYITAGVDRIILDAMAYQKPDFLKEVCKKFPRKIGMHIKVVGGKVVIEGWTVATRKTALDYAEQFKEAGVALILYSDYETENKITPADVSRIMEFSRKSPMPIIHSGDISNPNELELVLGLDSSKILGTIFGKSMYAGTIDIASTITHVKEESADGMDEPTLIP